MTASATEPRLKSPAPGDAAPAPPVQALDGHAVALADLWAVSERGLALVFLRHYGCPFCREHAREIDDHRAEFANAGIAVALVGCGTSEEAHAFRDDLGISCHLYNDPDRVAYRAYGLGEAPGRSVLNPAVLAGGVRAAARGFLPRRSSGHPLQLQGQFLIDRAGIIRSASRPRLMSDIPSTAILLEEAANLPGIRERTP